MVDHIEKTNNAGNSRLKCVLDKVFTLPVLKVVTLIVVGIMLVYVLVFSDSSNKDSVQNISSDGDAINNTSYRYMTTMEYAKCIEDKLIALISNVYGIGKVTVMVNLDGTTSYEYADISDSTSKKVSESMVSLNNQVYPVVLSEMLPKVSSVMIVAEGLTSKSKVQITMAVSSLLDLSTDRVYVLEG